MVVKPDWTLKFFPTVQVCISLLIFEKLSAKIFAVSESFVYRIATN